jgi:hypothetical protein
MVVVDLFTRETLLTHLNKHTQGNVAQTLLKSVIFQRGVPRTLRSDNAPELSSITGNICNMRIPQNRSDQNRRT